MNAKYKDAMEDIPLNTPTQKGKNVQWKIFHDSDHVGNRVTRWSHTGIIYSLLIWPPLIGTHVIRIQLSGQLLDLNM